VETRIFWRRETGARSKAPQQSRCFSATTAARGWRAHRQ